MGLAPADFERNGRTGYGDPHWAARYDRAVVPPVIQRASDPLPIVAA